MLDHLDHNLQGNLFSLYKGLIKSSQTHQEMDTLFILIEHISQISITFKKGYRNFKNMFELPNIYVEEHVHFMTLGQIRNFSVTSL